MREARWLDLESSSSVSIPIGHPGPGDPKPVADAIETGLARLTDHGFEAESCLLGLDGSDDIEAFNRTPQDIVDAATRRLQPDGGDRPTPGHR